MEAYFIFSDEAGDYKYPLTNYFIKAHPYFIRSGLLIKCEEWYFLRTGFRELQNRARLPTDCELKWAYIQSIIQHRKRNEQIPKDKEYACFSCYSNEVLLGFVEDNLKMLNKLDYCRIIYTITDNKSFLGNEVEESIFHRWHVQDLMQRTEYELQEPKLDGLGIMFLDPRKRSDRESKEDIMIRNAYADIYCEDKFVEEFSHILDSLTFIHSHHSIGIQIADYIAGVFSSFIRGYSIGTQLFEKHVWQLIRKSGTGNPLGWGICEIPSKNSARKKARECLIKNKLLPDSEVDYLI